MGETSLLEVKDKRVIYIKKSSEGVWENQDIEISLSGTPGVTFILR